MKNTKKNNNISKSSSVEDVELSSEKLQNIDENNIKLNEETIESKNQPSQIIPPIENIVLFNKVGLIEEKSSNKENAEITESIDYKNIAVLQKYLVEGWRIMPRRLSKLTKKQQKILKKSIKKSRKLMLIPYRPIIDI